MKLNVGSSGRTILGFIDVDVRPIGRNVKRGHAADLSFAADGSVDVLFCHAVLEHVFPAHHLKVVREWRRVLAPTGTVLLMGVPNFEVIARLYLEAEPGLYADRFDLHEASRYTHGDPEMETVPLWQRWDPAKHFNSAPPGYVPQLHKALFDSTYLATLFDTAGLSGVQFSYAYPGEIHRLNLGMVTGTLSVDEGLDLIPGIEDYLRKETVVLIEPRWSSDTQLGEVERLGSMPAPSPVRMAAHHVRSSVIRWTSKRSRTT